MIFNPVQEYHASFKANHRAIIIETYVVCGLSTVDHLYNPDILSLDTDNDTIGRTILKALSHSRNITTEEFSNVYYWEKHKPHHDTYIARICESIGCKTKRTLLKDMMYCSVTLKNGQITISPTRHVKLEAYDGLPDEEDVILNLDNSYEEIGAGLRLALSRCHGPGRMRDKLLKKPSS